jgi:hypothetical protein
MDIPNWDFDWQLFYGMPEDAYVSVAQGESITLTCTYDNSASNQAVIDGVQREPGTVTWGEGTLDEMCLMYIGVISPWVETGGGITEECAPVQDCVDQCDSSNATCVLNCDELNTECLVCMIGELRTCATPCLGDMLAARSCLQECGLANLSLGSSLADCMDTECPAEFGALTTCLDPVLESGACTEPLQSCTVSL